MGQSLYDGFVSLQEGMDAATPADYASMQFRSAMAVNVSHRGGYPHPRPGYYQHTLDFQSDRSAQTNFEDGLFQGATAYYPDQNECVLVASISGRMFRIEPDNGYRVTDITVADGPDNSLLLKAWFTQVENWLIKQNGIDEPVIFDGALSRRPNADEIKPGTCGVYAWGRYWYSMPSGREYRATDLVYGNGNRSDVLKETENTFLNGGGNFAVPGSAGMIRAMTAPAVLDNALGQGPVHVFCEHAIFSCNAPVDRDVWQTVTYPIQTVTLNQNGAMSDTSTIIVNGDIFYRSLDGFRSYILARRDFGNWANTPVSREIELFYKRDNTELLQCGTGGVWQNRAIFGVDPILIPEKGVVHRGLVSLDFDVISTMKAKLPPAWDGLWTGLKVHAVVPCTIRGTERMFLFVRTTGSNTLELWEMRSDRRVDATNIPIEWMVLTRQCDFGTRWSLKKLNSGELFVRNMHGRVYFDIDYRPDDYQCPIDWCMFSECGNTETCSNDECVVLVNRQPQYRANLTLPVPADECNQVADRNMRFGYKFQPIIKVTGYCELNGMRMKAETMPDLKDVACDSEPECKTLECCPINPFEYSAEEPT